jgi:hypothetical protein
MDWFPVKRGDRYRVFNYKLCAVAEGVRNTADL